MVKNDLFGMGEVDNHYTNTINVPQYEPTHDCPSIYELFDDRKYRSLVNDIEQSDILPEEKEFLKLAATRHIVFNYAKVADYYAHASKKVQELLEDSAMVIIDFDDAIAKGYVQLSKNIENIMRKTAELPKGYTEY